MIGVVTWWAVRLLPWCAVACAGDPDPTVIVQGGPLLPVAEGNIVSAELDIAPRPDGAAGLLDPALFTIEAAADVTAGVLAIEVDLGRPVLVVRPGCGLVRPGQGTALYPIQIATSDDSARPATVTLEVSETTDGACAPQVTWSAGTCAAPAAPASQDTIVVDPQQGDPQPMCLRFHNPDPGQDDLSMLIQGDVPELFDLPFARVTEFDDLEVDIGLRPTSFRGEFGLTWLLYRGVIDPPPDIVGVVPVAVGAPGDMAIEMRPTVPPLTSVPEFAVSEQPFRLWSYSGPGLTNAGACARATRVPPAGPPPAFPAVRLQGGSGMSVGDGEWLCGEQQYLLRLSPPVNAPAIEEIDLEAAWSADLAATRAQQALAFPVDSLAEDVACEAEGPLPFGEPLNPELACLQPEGAPADHLALVSRYRNDGSRLCVFPGNGRGRFGTRIDLDVEPLAMQTIERDVDGVAQRLLLGRFGGGDLVRKLDIDLAASPPTAVWTAAPRLFLLPGDLSGAPVGLAVAVGLRAPGAAGVTHLAYAGTNPGELWLRCVSPSCAPVSLPQATEIALGTGDPIAALAVTDNDGDGNLDLLVARVDAGVITIGVHLLDWSGADPVAVGGCDLLTQAVASTSYAMAAVADSPMPFWAAVDPEGAEILATGNQCGGVNSGPIDFASPGPIRGLVAGGPARFLVATAGGLLDAAVSPSALIWGTQDPVMQKHLLYGTLIALPDYGRGLVRCAAPEASVFYHLGGERQRWTTLDIPVGFL